MRLRPTCRLCKGPSVDVAAVMNRLHGAGVCIPSWDELRARRNEAIVRQVTEQANELGATYEEVGHNFDPNACYCACPDGPCEHDTDGPEWTSEDGCASSSTCSRCGQTAMLHDLRTMP